MNSQDDNSSLKRVALPAEGGCKGGSDSRSETLSPREWPTLIAELRRAIQHLENALIEEKDNWVEIWDNEIKMLREELAAERRRRPRGESAKLTDRGGEERKESRE